MVAKQQSPESPGKRHLVSFSMAQEGYRPDPDGDEFLDELEQQLEHHGLNPKDLVYSGFNKDDIARGKRPRHLMIFAMDHAGWREAIREHEPTPANYALTFERGVIGLYDRNDLREVYAGEARLAEEVIEAYKLDDSDTTWEMARGAEVIEGPFYDERVELDEIEPGDALSQLGPEHPVRETVVHKDYPNRPATDALVGLVYIDD